MASNHVGKSWEAPPIKDWTPIPLSLNVSRTLIKAYGICLDIIVFGKAGKLGTSPTMLNIGSGLALLGVGTVLCDLIVLHCMKKRYYYREEKYKCVEDYEKGLHSEMDQ